MTEEYMNDTQKLVSLISGYDADENGARDDGYYAQESIVDKMKYLEKFLSNGDADLWNAFSNGDLDLWNAFKFLEEEFYGDNKRYHAFIELK